MNKASLVILSLVLCSVPLFSQNCIDYGEFEGGTCVCAPPGWDISNGAPEIDQLSDYTGGGCNTNVTEESPTGGNFVAFNVLPGNSEAIETTVSGLTPGVEYSLAFWWMSVEWDCGGSIVICCSGLEVILDGTSYIFDPVEQWDLAEICFVAEDESIDIELLGTDDGMQGHVIIDDAFCEEESNCCPLILEVEEEYEICPGEDLQINAEYYNEVGSVTITWISDPPHGVDYLSDQSIIDPIFNLSTTDPEYEGELFEFCLTVEDDDCFRKKEFTIEVHPLTPPSFDFENIEICELEGDFIVPTISNEGISGSWNIPVVDLSEHAGTKLTLIFTPDPGEVPCPEVSEHELDINEYLVPSFDFPLIICRSDEDEIEFTDNSLEGVDGYWNYEPLELDQHPDGVLELIFTPDDESCSEIVILEIEIVSGEELYFELPSEYCSSQDIIIFPDRSTDGYDGSWSIESLDISNITGTFTNVFTANTQDCVQDYLYSFEVFDSRPVSFKMIEVLCRTPQEIQVDSYSLEGYLGYWNIETFSPDTIYTDSLILNWIPLEDDSLCLVPQDLLIEINDPATLEFQVDTILCVLDDVYEFPEPQTGITGSWQIASIDPSTIQDSFNNLFVVDDSLCALDYSHTIYPQFPLSPEFQLDSVFCIGDANYILPDTDLNGISGYWSEAEVNVSDLSSVGSEYYFIPTDPMLCADTFYQRFYLDELQVLEFSLPEKMCWNDEILELSEFSDNGILGVWNMSEIDPSMHQGSSLTLVFEPDMSYCAELYEWVIVFSEEPDLSVILTEPSSCGSDDAIIELQSNLPGLEFSIDGANSWQTDPVFDMLPTGDYTVIAREEDFNDLIDCYSEINATISDPDSPEILMLNVMDGALCEEATGSVEIIAEPEELEFSIDGGISWQDQNYFMMLLGGNYTVMVRPKASPDCISVESFDIEDPLETIILEIVLSDLDACSIDNGSIDIRAEGQNLEYSIDGGISWQDDPLFTMLAAGDYDVLVKSKDASDCIDERSVSLFGPEQVLIGSLDPLNPNQCDPESGQIIIVTQDQNIEYSIDGGMSWQDQNQFDDLEAGEYHVIIRDSEHPDCIDEQMIELSLDDELLELPNYELTDSDCWDDNGMVVFDLSQSQDLEYSLNNGQDWSSDPVITELGAGDYRIIVRDLNNPDCRNELEISINLRDCPCGDIEISYSIDPILCAGETGSISIENISGFDNSILSFEWYSGDNSMSLSNVQAGWYSFSIEYDNDCFFEDSIYLEDLDPLNYGLEVMPTDCEEALNGSIVFVDPTGGVMPYNYSLDGQNFQSESGFYNLAAGMYTSYLLDDNGCVKTEAIELLFEDMELISLDSYIEVEEGDIIYLNPLINENSIDSFSWSAVSGILNPGELIAQVQVFEETEFSLEIYYGDCTESRTIIIGVKEKDELYIPNIFSLSRTSVNTSFLIQSRLDSDIIIEEFRIYDRWGNMVYEKQNILPNDPDQAWDGYYNDHAVDPGVFVYVVQYHKDNAQHTLSGTITVIR